MTQSNSNSSSTQQPPSSTGKPKLKPTLSTKLPPFNAATANDEDSSDRSKLLDKTRSLSMTKRGPSNYEEACSIWNMGWKVSLATFCRISLSSISAAFLGHLGSDALAASALAMIWTNGVQILIFGFAVSLCTMCGQAYGAKNYELVGIWLQLGLIFLTLFSIPVMISFFYVDHLLSFVTDDLEVLHLADTYARYLVPTVLPQAVYCALRQYLQAQEIVTPATIISILSVGVCLVSNYVFIYGFGPIPALHFIGSPIAQCVASIFQPVALYVYAFWYKGYHKKTWYGFKVEECLQWERVKYFISLSLGMTLNLALDEWVYNVVSSLAGSMGAMNLAANSVMFNLWGLIFAVYWGFGLPTQVRAANFLGANEPALAQQTLRVGFVLGGIAAALSALFVFAFRHWIISVFTPDLEVAAIINHTLPVFCVAVFVSGLHIILAAVVEAMSLASTLVRITCTGSWLVLLPSSYLLGVVWDGGLQGLWWGSVLGEGTKFVLMAYALLRIDWTEMALRAVKQSEGNVLDEQEMEEDVEFRASFMSATTPTMSGRSPVVTIFSAPQQVHHHRKDQRGSDMEEGAKFRSSSYGATDNINKAQQLFWIAPLQAPHSAPSPAAAAEDEDVSYADRYDNRRNGKKKSKRQSGSGEWKNPPASQFGERLNERQQKMYVTRRFLRSTIPPSSSNGTASASDGARKSGSSSRSGRRGSEQLPSSTEESSSESASPRRRPLLRSQRSTSESNGEPASTPTNSAAKKKASPRVSRSAVAAQKQHEQRSNAEVKSSKETGKTKDSESSSSTTAVSNDPQDKKIEFVGLGLLVDARDTQERWCEAKIIGLNAKKKEVFVHYVGWNARYDAWISAKFLAAHGSHTGEARKNASSWDGKTSLFALVNAVKKESGVHHPEKQKALKHQIEVQASPVAKSRKKKSESSVRSPSPVATRKRRGRGYVGEADDDHSDKEESKGDERESDGDHTSTPKKRAKRNAAIGTAAVVNVKVKSEPPPGVKAEAPKKKPQLKKQKASPKAVKVQPVRVVVATTDEASERKSRRNRRENVDMELDMDIRCENDSQISSTSASEEEEEEEEAQATSVSESDTAKSTRKATNNKSKRNKPKTTSESKISLRKRAASNATKEAEAGEASESDASSQSAAVAAVVPVKQAKSLDEKANASDSGATTTTKKRGGGKKEKSVKAKAKSKHQPPPRAPRMTMQISQNASATREKLAAIFRLRVQQKQQLELQRQQMFGGMSQRSLQEVMQATTAAGTNPLTPTAASAAPAPASAASVAVSLQAADDDAAAQEAYIHYHHAQQLQQYYYQQAMLASSMHMMETSDEAAANMQGGIMDPRVIQARVDALELQRRVQQQQLHDYYQHVAITRERNMQALASSHEFLVKSGQAWQQQSAQINNGGQQHSVEDVVMDQPTTKSGETTTNSGGGAEMDELEEKMYASASISSPEEETKNSEKNENEASSSSQTESPAKQSSNSNGESSDDSPTRSSPEQSGKQIEKSASGGSGVTDTGAPSAMTKKAENKGDKGTVLYEFVL